jgi:glutamate/tyrosine decarboxylase-like PLP-dependent enzyme
MDMPWDDEWGDGEWGDDDDLGVVDRRPRNPNVHITAEGKAINIRDMTDSHLKNMMAFIERRAIDGVALVFGHDGDADVNVIYGSSVMNLLGYEAYEEEFDRRVAAGQWWL